MQTVSPTPAVRTAAELASALVAAGWAPGYPPPIAHAARAVDVRACKRARCPGCGRRGLDCRPYHRPDRPGYRIVAACGCCCAAEEF